jgi:Flp pilus assembly protein TadD
MGNRKTTTAALTTLYLRRTVFCAIVALILTLSAAASADLKVKVPRHTKPTPVQELNQNGVRALQKNDVARARRDFYKAYLLDPDDPFTLNNLGYLAELDGNIERAQKFYDLAAANSTDALVALSSNPELKGKEVSQVAGNVVSATMQVNRLNVAALGMMRKDRAPEAEQLLRKAYAISPQNPFTLNNLGYALEKQGELEQAAHYYSEAALIGSQKKVVVAFNRSWRGRPITEIASRNAAEARRELSASGSVEARVTRLNVRGVTALNRNQTGLAQQYFQQAYHLDPNNAFALNNMGYISELEGDRETAGYYYDRARGAYRNDALIALASRKTAEGFRLSAVANKSEIAVSAAQEQQLADLRASGAKPLPLRTRDQAIVREPPRPPAPEPEAPVRVVAVDNPPPEPQAMASPVRRVTPSAPPVLTRQQPAAAQPATVVPPLVETEDDRPLLPVIPDPPAR